MNSGTPDDNRNADADDSNAAPMLSLDQLSDAFAQLLKTDDARTSPTDAKATSPASEVASTEDDEKPGKTADKDEDEGPIEARALVEAMLFVGSPDNRPLAADHIASLLRGVTPPEVDAIADELNAIYDAEGAPYRIELADQGYRLALRKTYFRLRDRFYGRDREAKLSQAALEVLAVVSYQQPIDRATIDKQRGKSSSALLEQLVRRKLLALERSNDTPRTVRYRTTARFLELFQLKSLNELPRSQDLDRQ